MQTKDYFSGHASLYATFRPTYPEDLYHFIFSHLKNRNIAWDCATGNGQIASRLSENFKEVIATDISQAQLDQAPRITNVTYRISPAEKTPFADHQFDLITVGQALHWFNLEAFYEEVTRVGKPGSLIALWGYTHCHVNPEIDPLCLHFYSNIVGPYWDSARKLVEDEYRGLPFPFKEIITPKFMIKVRWTREQFTGYLTTWSATQKNIKATGENPVLAFDSILKGIWNDHERHTVTFPVFLRLGIIG